MGIRSKFLIPAASSLLVLGLATAVLATLAFTEVMGRRLSTAHETHIEAVRREVLLSSQQAMELAGVIASRAEVVSAYRAAALGDLDDPLDAEVQSARQRLRADLRDKLAPVNAVNDAGELLVHFHLPNSRSFVRLWRDRQRLHNDEWVDISDDLSDFRRTVVEVNRSGSPRGGIELGRAGFTIRGVVPVRDENGVQLGSAEVLRPFGRMLTEQLARPETYFAVLMDEVYLDVTTDLRNNRRLPVHASSMVVVMARDDGVLAERLDPDLIEAGRDRVVHGWSGPLFASVFPVHDAFGQPIGVVWLATDESELVSAQAWFRQRLAVVTTLMVAALSFLLLLVGRKVCQPLHETSQRLAEIADGDGDLGVRLEVSGHDEASQLARLFNRFMERLQDSFTVLTRNTARLQRMVMALPVDGERPDVAPEPESGQIRRISDAIGQTERIIRGVETSLDAVQQAEEARRLLAAVVRSSGDAIMALSLDGVVLSWNRGASQMYGWQSEDMVGRSYGDLFPDDSDDLTAVLTAVRNGEQLQLLETNRSRRNGSTLPVSMALAPIRDSQGDLSGASVIERDISKRKEAERSAEEQRKQLVQADRLASLGTLVAGVAHEISNPTSSITVNAPVVKDLWSGIVPMLDDVQTERGPLSVGTLSYETVRQHVPTLLDDISHSAARIEAIVRSLKDFARCDAPVADELVDLNEVVRSALTLTRNRVQKSTLDLSVELAEALPKVRGNTQRIEQVVVNLILNACDALAHSSQSLRISTAVAGSRVMVSVIDDGVGIPPEIMGRIRDPFFTTKRDSGGTGLGLSISSGIVEDHGGTLDICSEPGDGTVITVALPAVEKEDA